MSQDIDPTPKRSLKSRLKPYAPFAITTLVLGALIVRSTNTKQHITVVIPDIPDEGAVCLSRKLVEQVLQEGEAMFELAPGRLVDIIDWGHPKVANR